MESELAYLDRLEITKSHYMNATRNAYSYPQSCESSSVSLNTPLHRRTLCPWDYVQDYDEHRFPPVLTVARCKCRNCLDEYHKCKPVLYSIHVLRRECIDNTIRWIRRTQLISVACTCSRPSLVHVKRKKKWKGLADVLEFRKLTDEDVL
ncbi:hypothetical protein ACF0H5_016537 [Mactra antiquata]